MKLYDEQFDCKKNEQQSENNEQNEKLLNFIKTGLKYAKGLRNYVSQIIYKHYEHNDSIDNLINFIDIFDSDLLTDKSKKCKKEYHLLICFLIDEINNLLFEFAR